MKQKFILLTWFVIVWQIPAVYGMERLTPAQQRAFQELRTTTEDEAVLLEAVKSSSSPSWPIVKQAAQQAIPGIKERKAAAEREKKALEDVIEQARLKDLESKARIAAEQKALEERKLREQKEKSEEESRKLALRLQAEFDQERRRWSTGGESSETSSEAGEVTSSTTEREIVIPEKTQEQTVSLQVHKKKVASLRWQLRKQTELARQAIGEKEKAEKKVDEFKRYLSEVDITFQSMQESQKQTLERVAFLTQALEQSEKGAASAQQALQASQQEKEREIVTKRILTDEVQALKVALDKSIQEKVKALEEAKLEKEQLQRDHTQKLAQLKQNKRNRKIKLQEAEKSIKAFAGKETQLIQQIDDLKAQLASRDGELKRNQGLQQQSLERIDFLSQELAATAEKTEYLNQQLIEAQKQTEELIREKEKISVSKESIDQQLLEVQNRLTTATQEAVQATQRAEEAQEKSTTNYKQQIDELEKDLDQALKEKNMVITEAANHLRYINDIVKQNISQANYLILAREERINKLENKLRNQETLENKFKKKIEQLQRQYKLQVIKTRRANKREERANASLRRLRLTLKAPSPLQDAHRLEHVLDLAEGHPYELQVKIRDLEMTIESQSDLLKTAHKNIAETEQEKNQAQERIQKIIADMEELEKLHQERSNEKDRLMSALEQRVKKLEGTIKTPTGSPRFFNSPLHSPKMIDYKRSPRYTALIEGAERREAYMNECISKLLENPDSLMHDVNLAVQGSNITTELVLALQERMEGMAQQIASLQNPMPQTLFVDPLSYLDNIYLTGPLDNSLEAELSSADKTPRSEATPRSIDTDYETSGGPKAPPLNGAPKIVNGLEELY